MKLAADWRLDIHIRESAAQCEVGSRLDIGIFKFMKKRINTSLHYHNNFSKKHSANKHLYKLNKKGQHHFELCNATCSSICQLLKYFLKRQHSTKEHCMS